MDKLFHNGLMKSSLVVFFIEMFGDDPSQNWDRGLQRLWDCSDVAVAIFR